MTCKGEFSKNYNSQNRPRFGILRAMKIKVPPHDSAPQGQTIIIKEQREGCFLQTLNLGCAIFALIVVLLLAALAWAIMTASRARENQSRAPAPRAAKTTQAAAAPEKAPPSPSSAWIVAQHKDAITDEVSFFLVLDGDPIKDGLIEYTPQLVLKVPRGTDGAGDFAAAESAIKISPEAVKRQGVVADVRINQNAAESIALTPSESRDVVFFPANFTKRLDGARTLVVRLTTSLGNTRTYRFNLGGVSHYTLGKKIKAAAK